MSYIPQAGEPLTSKDVEIIVEAIVARQQNFPGEPTGVTIALVLMNIGDRYSPIECTEQEYKTVKEAVIPEDGPPRCPNGHELHAGPALKIGWL